jgi:hypothetical protein
MPFPFSEFSIDYKEYSNGMSQLAGKSSTGSKLHSAKKKTHFAQTIFPLKLHLQEPLQTITL